LAAAEQALEEATTQRDRAEAALNSERARYDGWMCWASGHLPSVTWMRDDGDRMRANIDAQLTAAREGQQRAERERDTSIAAERQALKGLEIGHAQFEECATALSAASARLNAMTGHVDASIAQCCDEADASLARLARVEEAAKVILKRWDDCDIEGCDSDWTKLRAALDGGKAT
jgi:hypothetical protein